MDKICFGNITFDDYGCPKGYCIITNKTSFMDDVTWTKVVGIFISNITKMELYALIFICCDTCYPPPPPLQKSIFKRITQDSGCQWNVTG